MRVGRFQGRIGDLASWGELDTLIQERFCRAAHFRVAADDINYRRFSNINFVSPAFARSCQSCSRFLIR